MSFAQRSGVREEIEIMFCDLAGHIDWAEVTKPEKRYSVYGSMHIIPARTSPEKQGRIWGRPGANLSGGTKLSIMGLLTAGYSIRETARLCIVHRDTVMMLLRQANTWRISVGQDVFRCPCGKALTEHRGWCQFRVSRSPKRQQFLQQRWGKLKAQQESENVDCERERRTTY